MREQTARAVIEINEALAASETLQVLADNLFTAIKPFVACDWLGIFNIYRHDKRVNVTTNSGLPFDWDTHYFNIAEIDSANRKTLASHPGTCLHFPCIYNPANDQDRYVLDYIKRTSDTATGMILPVATTASNHRLALGLFREGPRDGFDQDAELIVSTLHPLIAASCHTILDRTQAELRASLASSDPFTPYILFDQRWAIIDFPYRTLSFLREIYQDEKLSNLPAEITEWLNLVRQLETQVSIKLCLAKALVMRRLSLKLNFLSTRDGQFYGLLRLIDQRTNDDFRPLTACGLTLREIALLNYLPAGYSNSQIATALGIKEITVKKHLRLIGDKLGAAGKTEILYTALSRLLELNGQNVTQF